MKMRMEKIFSWAMLVGCLLCSVPAFANPIDDAITAYRSGELVYVAPDATMGVDAGRLTNSIKAGTVPIFIAVLPPIDAAAAVGQIGNGMGTPVAVGILAGKSFRAGASAPIGELLPSTVATLATKAFQDSRQGGATLVLSDWVSRLNTYQPPQGVTMGTLPSPAAQGGHPFLALLAVLVIIGVIIFFVVVLTRRPRVNFDDEEYDTPVDGSGSANTVTLNGKTYRRSSTATPGYQHFAGGYYEGRYVPAGYYSDPFWNWMVLSTVLDSRQNYPSAIMTPEPSWTVTQPMDKNIGGGDFPSGVGGGNVGDGIGGGDIAPSSGGGDITDSPRSESHYSSSSHSSSSSSYGGGDFGSSSGGGDFGGSSGGGDFGSSSDGGDFSGGSGGGDF